MANKNRNSEGQFAPTHGLKNHPLYKKWCSMRERCNNPHNGSYHRYGGKGITVCEEWNDFEAFYEWSIENGWEKGLTIDRIDNAKGYSPDNCRYVSHKEQNRNYSRNHLITYKGETLCLADWADRFGIKRATVLYRIKAGKPLDEVFSKVDGRSTRWQKVSLQD